MNHPLYKKLLDEKEDKEKSLQAIHKEYAELTEYLNRLENDYNQSIEYINHLDSIINEVVCFMFSLLVFHMFKS